MIKIKARYIEPMVGVITAPLSNFEWCGDNTDHKLEKMKMTSTLI